MEETSEVAPADAPEVRLLIEAARRVARRRHRQDGVLAGAVVVVVLTIALASSGLFAGRSSGPIAVGGPVLVPGPGLVGECAPAPVWVEPGPGGARGFTFVAPAPGTARGWAACVVVPGVPVSPRIRVWRVAP